MSESQIYGYWFVELRQHARVVPGVEVDYDPAPSWLDSHLKTVAEDIRARLARADQSWRRFESGKTLMLHGRNFGAILRRGYVRRHRLGALVESLEHEVAITKQMHPLTDYTAVFDQVHYLVLWDDGTNRKIEGAFRSAVRFYLPL